MQSHEYEIILLHQPLYKYLMSDTVQTILLEATLLEKAHTNIREVVAPMLSFKMKGIQYKLNQRPTWWVPPSRRRRESMYQ